MGAPLLKDKKLPWAALFAMGLICGALLYPHLPFLHGVPLCPFRALTGYSCPGCGMTRACVLAVHGQWWASLEHNPFGLPLVAGSLLFGADALSRWLRARPLVRRDSPRRARLVGLGWWAGLIAVVLFGAARLVLELTGFLTPI